MSKYFETIFDVTTNETTIRQYSLEEIKAMQDEEEKILAAEALENAKKTAALAKLETLGLTVEDFKALL